METYATIEIDPAVLKTLRGDRSGKKTAEKLGISYQYLWMIENGKRHLSGKILARMLLLYGVTIEDVLGRDKFLPAA